MPSRQLRLTQVVVLVAITATIVTCTDSRLPTPPGADQPQFLIRDGAHNGGNEDVFFSPPLTESPSGTVCFALPCTGPGPFGDRPVNPRLAPVAHICELRVGEPPNHTQPVECKADGHVDDLPMTYNASGGFYSANLKDVDFVWNVAQHYRIAIMLGSLELGIRDMDPDEGPNTASCASDPFCQFNVGGSGSVPVKVFIESGAACIATGGNPNLCATASFDLSQGGSLGLQQQMNGQLETIATADVPAQGAGTSTVTMQACVTPGGDLSQLIDIPLFGDCVEISADDLPVTGVASLCRVDDGGLSATQGNRITIHRAKLDAGEFSGWTVIALPDADANCPAPESLGLSTLDRLRMFARSTVQSARAQLVAWLSPHPLAAAICDKGCGGTGGFESSFQAGLPTWQGFGVGNPGSQVGPLTWDLGTYDVGTPVTATVRAWDSGELEPFGTTPVPEAVAGARLTVTPSGGTVNSNTIFSGPDGTATFQLTVGPGINTVEVAGRGVGDPETGAFTPDHLDPNPSVGPVTLSTGTLTFTAVGKVPLVFEPDPPQNPADESNVFFINAATGVATIPVTVCTSGTAVPDVPITSLVLIKNNGDPVAVGGFAPGSTGADGCYSMSAITVNKTGAYRVVVNGEFTSQKINVKPPPKK